MLHRDGFTIIENAISINGKELEEIKKQSDKYGKSIFNENESIGYHGNDFKRRQSKIKINDKTKNLVDRFHTTLTNKFSNLSVSDTVVLHSLPNCREQEKHMDYLPNEIFANKKLNDDVPLAAILALESETTITIWPKSIYIASQKNKKYMRKKND
jgi:hypothetical protein